MEIEFRKAKEELAILELKNSNLVKEKQESILLNSLINDELSSLHGKVSTLEKGKACESSITSISPSC